MKKTLLLLLMVLGGLMPLGAQTVSTPAGLPGSSGLQNGIGSAARFNSPHGIATDRQGNIYIADRVNNVIRKVSSNGTVSTFAGSGIAGAVDASGTAASFFEPHGITCDTAGNVYVADTKNFKIRKITPAGVVTTLAGQGVFGTTNGPAATARFGYPVGIAVSPDGATIYVSDYNTHVIRKVEAGNVTTVAGMIYVTGSNNGTGSAATFNHPSGLCMETSGNLLIADEWNNLLRRMSPAGTVTTVAGTGFPGGQNGTASAATFNGLTGISVGAGNRIYIADALNNTIRCLETATQQVSTFAGINGSTGSTDGPAAAATFNLPYGITTDPLTNGIYITDQLNHTIRKILSLSAIQLTLTPVQSTVCFGDSLRFTISPSGLSNYSISENGTTLAASGTGTIAIAPQSAGTHTFVANAVDGNGAMASSAAVTVTVNPEYIPVINAPSLSLCPGDSLQLTASAGSSFSWSNGATTQTIYVNTGGNYTVSVVNASGCRGTSSTTTITQLTVAPVSITPTGIQVCPGATATLTASTGLAYLWSNGATTQSITSTSGTYTVSVTQTNGCKATRSATIATYTVSPPVISPGGTQQLFPGDSVLLTATGSSSYSWSNGASGSSVYASQTGSYSVTGTDANGCTSVSAPVQVVPFNTSTLLVVNGPLSFCESDSTFLQSAISGGNQWFYNAQPIPGATADAYYPDQSGYYKVRVTIGSNQVFSDSVLITVWPVPADPQIAPVTICSGNTATLTASGSGNSTYQWYTSETGSNPIFNGDTYTTPGLTQYTEYFVEAVSPEGCRSGSRTQTDVTVLASPIAAFTHAANYLSGNWNVQFTNQSTDAISSFWLLGDTATSSMTDPLHTYPQSAEYAVTLIVTAANGCTDTLQRNIPLFNNTSVFVPTTFTPNGDGKNDVFRVRGERVTVEDMRIFTQWGNLIWQSNAGNVQWDGLSSGSIVANGTYFYRIRITENNGKESELTGTVTVIK